MNVKAVNIGRAVKAGYFNERVAYKPITGINKLCAQCIKECKQWKQVVIIRCPFFKSRQQKSVKVKVGDTLLS